MGSSIMLLQLILIAAVVYIPLMRFRAFRALVGFKDMARGDHVGGGFEERCVHIISKAGQDSAVEADGALVFRTTPGVRLVITALVALLLFQFVILGFAGLADILAFLIIVAAAIWFVYYAWVFQVRIRDTEFRWIDWLLRERVQDLSRLQRVEQDSSGGYRLEFDSGGAAYIFRYVNGHGILKDFLTAALSINRR